MPLSYFKDLFEVKGSSFHHDQEDCPPVYFLSNKVASPQVLKFDNKYMSKDSVKL